MGEKPQEKKLRREFSAGGVVYRKNGKGGPLWLIIKPAGVDRWQLPKGKIDAGETARTAAVREVMEEGGVKCRVVEKLRDSKYFFVFEGQKVFKTVSFFLMEYLEGSESNHDREIDEASFTDYNTAYGKLTFKDDKETLKKAKEVLDKGVQPSLV